ncbi:hypothetical protein NRB15_17480, partial [Pseudomonas alliivorans]|uniref:hypothetical protein n=1 Tax=Pseudomonas alliivorans TaxID=2810613 RepID=UPI00211C4451
MKRGHDAEYWVIGQYIAHLQALFYIATGIEYLFSSVLKITVDALVEVSIIRPTSGADGNEK